MSQVIAAIGFGLVTSSILALGSVGFTLQFGVSNIFNLAYGDVMTVGAFGGYVLNVDAHLPIAAAFAGGAVAGGLASVVLNRLVYRVFLRRGTSRFAMVMVSLAAALIIQNALQVVFGTQFRTYALGPQKSLHILGMLFTPMQLVIIAVALLSMAALHLVLRYTRLGKAMRASATNAELAGTCGISTDVVTDAAWLISGALCGLSGVALALNLEAFDFTFGAAFLLTIVAAAVFGSVGQPYGAMVGAVVIGLVSELVAIVSPSLKEVVAFLILVLILLIRPNGLWSRVFVEQAEIVVE